MIKQFLNREKILLLLILLLAAGLRFWNIHWGLPDVLEEATPLVKANKMWNWSGSGVEMNPQFFNYPALTFYLLFLVQGIQYLLGHALGIYADMQSFGASLSTSMVPARIVIGLFDVGSVLAIYVLARKFTDTTGALIAATLVAINPLHIMQAHYITVDTPLTLFILLALMAVYRLRQEPSTKHYLLAGLCIGLAAATKYTGAFLLIVLVLVHLLRSDSIAKAAESLLDKRLLLSIAASVVLFFLLNPYIILNYEKFRMDFSFEQYHVAEGHLGADLSQATIDYYLLDVLPSNMGFLLTLLVPVVLGHWLLRKEKKYWPLLLFPVVYIAIISTWEMRVERYLLPVIPLLLLVCAIGLRTAWGYLTPFLGQSMLRNLQTGVAGVLLLGCVLQPLSGVYEFQRSIVIPDTRTVAKHWIEENVEPGSFIVSGPFGIQIPETSYHVLYIPFIVLDVENVAPFYNTQWFEDFELLIASDFDYSRYAGDPKKYASFLPFYDSLRSRWTLLHEIKPQEHQRGPTLWFYAYPDSLRRIFYDRTLLQHLHDTPESAKASYFLNNLSIVLMQKRMLEKSEQVLREILTVEVNNQRARNSLAKVLYRLDNYEGALFQVQRSLRTNPQQAELFSFAGDILQKMGRRDEAERSYMKAIDINQGTLSAYRALISLYSEEDLRSKLKWILEMYSKILPPNSDEAKGVAEQLESLKGSP